MDPRKRQYFEGYGFLSFAKNLASSRAAKKARDAVINQGKEAAIKAGKRAVNKTAEATGDFVGQRVADKITKRGSKSPKSEMLPVPEVKSVDNLLAQVRDMTPEKRAQIINELSLL